LRQESFQGIERLSLSYPDRAQAWTREGPLRWLPGGFRHVPGPEIANTLAMRYRRAETGNDAIALAEALGFALKFCALRASEGGLEAALVPNAERRFIILCDPWTEADEPVDRVQLRVAHELAHTFFYDWSSSLPRHLLVESPAEERFCDLFAATFIAPSTD